MRIRSGKFAALLALTLGAGAMQATNLLTVASPVAVTCNPATGPGAAASIVVQPVTALTGTNTIAVTVTAPNNGLKVTNPTSQTLNATTAKTLTYTVTASSATCAGATNGAAVTIQFNAGGNADATSTANVTITSPLVASPASVALTCQLSGGNYTQLSTQTESITSTITGGTAFTVNNTGGSAPPGWVSLSSLAGGTATSTPVTFTVTPVAGCGGFALGSVHTGTINLSSAGVADLPITVTLTILAPDPLTGTLSSSSITYVKNSGSPAAVTLSVTSSPTGLFFTVNTATLPVWLTVNTTSGTAPYSLVFSTTSICDTLAPGTYTATIQYSVAGDEPHSSTISLLITNKPATLSVVGQTTQNLSWILGTPIPTASITLISTDAPIAYTVVSGGALDPIIPASEQSGLAYNFGTSISMTFNPSLFNAASPGKVLTGTVTISSGTSSSIVVTINITVVLPGAALTGLTPASLPTAAAGTVFNITLVGSNFVASADPTQKTKVGILGNANAVVLDNNFSYTVTNPSNINLTITVPASADPALPFAISGAGGTVVIAVCNPAGAATCTVTGQQTLTISPGPIIQAITSASSFTEVAPGSNPTTSGYDILSVFGSDFCASGGTGCGTTTVLTATLDAADRYKTSVTPDSGSSPRNLTVSFYLHGPGGAFLASAPLLFATNNQINLLVPAAVNAHVGAGTVDMVVNFGTAAMPATETAAATSAIHTMNIAATDPGVFTEGADGQGSAAALAANYAPITQANPAGMRATANSDTVLLYVSGLGVPNSTAADTSGGSNTWPTDCISVANYQSALATASGLTLASIDGAIFQSSLIDPSRYAPCIAGTNGTPSIAAPTMTIGGVAVPANNITYAGFVEGSVAGLYQINVQLPSSTGNYYTSPGGSTANVTTEVALPVVVTYQGASSQTGVNVWVKRELSVTAPTALTGTVGTAWSGSNNSVIASDGTSPYTYAVTAGAMPNGVSFTDGGAIAGTPNAGTGGQYQITVTATDSTATPITGSVQFTLTVAAGLYLTANPSGNLMGTHGASAPATTVTAVGGVAPYTYGPGANLIVTAFPAGGSANDITLNTSTGVVTVQASSKVGTYSVTVTATDSSGTPLTGSYSFTIDLS